MKERQQSSTSYPMTFLMVSSTDHVTPVTGLTPIVTISKNGGAFASPSGSVSEVGNGWYQLAGNATDRGTLGEFLLHATGTGADPADKSYEIVPWDPFDGADLGLTNLDAAISTRALESGGNIATILARVIGTLAAGTHQPQSGDAYSRIGAAGAGLTALGDSRIANLDAAVSTRAATGDAMTLTAGAVDDIWDEDLSTHSAYDTAYDYLVNYIDADVVGLWDMLTVYRGGCSTAGADYIDLPAGASAVDDIFNGNLIFIHSGTGQYQTRQIVDYDGTSKRLYVSPAWAAVPTTSDLFTILPMSSVSLTAAAVDSILDEPVEGIYTLRQIIRILAAALAGKASGGGTSTITFRNMGDSTDRIVATVDANGNRTAIVLDVS